MPLSPATEQALKSFLCDHFDALELTHLARGILADQPSLLHSLPPAPAPLATLAEVFLGIARRHGFIDDEFFLALCAARPRLRGNIHSIWEKMSPRSNGVSGTVKRNRISLRLEVDLEDLTDEILEEILPLIRLLSGDPRMKIESITKGSAIFVLRGEEMAVARLMKRFSEQPITLKGYRVTNAALIPAETSPGSPDVQLRGPKPLLSSEMLVRTTSIEQAPRLILDRYQAVVNRAIRRTLGRDRDHDDLVQSVFLALFSAIQKGKQIHDLDKLVINITHHTILRELRRRRLRGPWTRRESELPDTSLLDRVYIALNQLSPRQHLAYSLAIIEMRPLSEVAAACEVSLMTAKRDIRGARQHLQRLVEKDPVLAEYLHNEKWASVSKSSTEAAAPAGGVEDRKEPIGPLDRLMQDAARVILANG